ncbi:MAG: bifunctional (p)ppGpp synthetase/guanosine-3',5'-bis(diphosphate) 3'-pyrophosphohydrolase [Burkholderiales bacterium]|nr:bifunctional (p)ppGpp synthetase/guanosine-3',5'-bis(diphosphate) 3'-pyrophosphohydrolase [Burkholderiales bacterium]
MAESKALSVVAHAAADPQAWLALLGERFGPEEQRVIERALALARADLEGRLLGSGESALEHALATAATLAELNLDHESVAASLLLDLVPTSGRARERLTDKVGQGVVALVEGAARMAQIDALGASAGAEAQADAQLEGLRKMLLAMAQDFRVVFIKLASHTQALRHLVKGGSAAERAVAARLSLDIFAPLANRLGVWQLKWELEDLAFRLTDPDLYKRIARMLDEKRVEREQFIAAATARLSEELRRAGMRFEISGRPKHIYSIYKKMQRKALAFEQLYDVNALRVFVADVKDCYTALGVVHNLWTPLPREFDDYIAKPKGNDYRSLHTAVVGPGGRVLEVQIRTQEMHRQAELGIAAHWRYKEGSRGDRRYDEKVAWLRQILEWKDERSLAEHFKAGLFDDAVYVLTPQGKVIDLPAGSTPVDFAYAVHTDLGHRCRGARVDGVMVPLSTPLKHGQSVEIVAAKQGGPSRDWLNPALGFTASHRARAKVRQWFNAQNLEAAIAHGRGVVDKELQRTGATALNLETLAGRAGYAALADFLAAVGRGEINARQLQAALREPAAPAPTAEASPLFQHKARAAPSGRGILLVGVDKLLTVPAKCCKPAPPDAIVGFVTRGRGVTIHRANCANVRTMDAQRLIAADWGQSEGGAFEVDIEVDALDRTGLLRDVSDTLARERINVVAANTGSRDAAARMLFTIEVLDLPQLERVLGLLERVPGVTRARRR